jgi:hypothetical protein
MEPVDWPFADRQEREQSLAAHWHGERSPATDQVERVKQHELERRLSVSTRT